MIKIPRRQRRQDVTGLSGSQLQDSDHRTGLGLAPLGLAAPTPLPPSPTSRSMPFDLVDILKISIEDSNDDRLARRLAARGSGSELGL